VKGTSPHAQSTTTKRALKEDPEVNAQGEEVLGQEVIARLKSWCYV